MSDNREPETPGNPWLKSLAVWGGIFLALLLVVSMFSGRGEAPGTPILYGSFTSNVDMKSGSPAFGTPEYAKAAFGAGQLARYIKVPWRSSSATASNAPDAQAAYEAQMSLWGALMGGANFMLHAAGWVEGGLSTSYEKFIMDIEMLQMFAEVFQPVGAEASDMALDAIAELGSGSSELRGVGTAPVRPRVECGAEDVVEELVDMIETQRAYEMNSKAIQTCDEMLQFVSQTL